MKTIKRLFVLIICLLLNVVVVNADEFVPHVSLESFDGSNLVVNLWYGGANVSEIEHTIRYDYNKLEMISNTGVLYSSNITHERNEDNYSIDKVYSVAMEDNFNTTYVTITFKVKDSLSVGKTAFITLDDFLATSLDGSKYKSEPLVVTVRRESINKVYFFQDYLNDIYKRQIWLNDNYINIITVAAIIIIVLFLFIISPGHFGARKKTNSMKKKINKNSGKKSIAKFDLNPDKIQEIGRKKKPEPKNKLELGSFDPLANNKRKNK